MGCIGKKAEESMESLLREECLDDWFWYWTGARGAVEVDGGDVANAIIPIGEGEMIFCLG